VSCSKHPLFPVCARCVGEALAELGDALEALTAEIIAEQAGAEAEQLSRHTVAQVAKAVRRCAKFEAKDVDATTDGGGSA